MSNDYVDYVMELIYEDIDRDDIKVKIAEQRFEESFQ